MRPFLLLATRAQDIAADAEFQAIVRLGGLAPHELHRIRLEAGPMPALRLDDYSGVILGGSPFNASADRAAKSPTQVRVESELAVLLDEIVDRDLPFFGACYGVGALGTHQGAVIDGTYGEPVGPVDIRLTDAGRIDPLLDGLPTEFAAYVGHTEAVRDLPGHAVVLATSEHCPIQMFRIKNNVYATQFHPELDLVGILTRIDVYRDHGYFTAEEIDEVISRVHSRAVTYPARLLSNFVRLFGRDDERDSAASLPSVDSDRTPGSR